MNTKAPVDWVDPLIDSANRRFFFLTTASHPFGMVNLSPDTRVGEDAWDAGYRYVDDSIHWFSHVHAWQLCGIPVMPTMGAMRGPCGSEVYKSHFNHDSEVATPGYHAVTLDDYAIRAELTATTRVGLHRYTFTKAGRAWILIDLLYGKKQVIFRKTSGNTRVTIFEGRHEIIHQAALNWLANQRKGTPARWDITLEHDVKTDTWKVIRGNEETYECNRRCIPRSASPDRCV